MNRTFITLGFCILFAAILMLDTVTYFLHRNIAEREREALQKALSANVQLSSQIHQLSNANKALIEGNRKLLVDYKETLDSMDDDIRLMRRRVDICAAARK